MVTDSSGTRCSTAWVGLLAMVWFGWAQEDPPKRWRVWLGVGSGLGIIGSDPALPVLGVLQLVGVVLAARAAHPSGQHPSLPVGAVMGASQPAAVRAGHRGDRSQPVAQLIRCARLET